MKTHKLFPTPLRLAALLALGALCPFASQPVTAATLYWSGNGTTQGGAGTWDTSNQRWGSSASGPFSTTWDNTANASDTALFGTTAGTVTTEPSM